MERFLSPGYKVKPPEPPEEPVRRRGRPAKEVLEGERVEKMLQMLDEAEEQNKGLLEQMRLKRCLSFEEDEGGRKRKHDGGVLSPKMLEVCE